MTIYHCQDCKASIDHAAIVLKQHLIPVEFFGFTSNKVTYRESCPNCGSEFVQEIPVARVAL